MGPQTNLFCAGDKHVVLETNAFNARDEHIENVHSLYFASDLYCTWPMT